MPIVRDAVRERVELKTLVLSGVAGVVWVVNRLFEIAPGKFRGDIGLKLETGAEAALEIAVSGRLAAEAGPEDGKLRLRIRGTDCSIRVRARLDPPEPAAVRELAAAIIGVHPLQWLADVRDTFRTGIPHWAVGKFELPAAVLAEPGLPNAALAERAAAESGFERLQTALESAESYARLGGWMRRQAEDIWGPVAGDSGGLARARESLNAAAAFAKEAYGESAPVVGREAAAALVFRLNSASEGTPLIDCSFPKTEEGLRLCKQALSGDLRAALAGSDIHAGILTQSIPDRIAVELPPLNPDLDARMIALAGDLRVGARIHDPDALGLSWTHRGRTQRVRARDSLAMLLGAYGFGDGPGRWIDSQTEDAEIDVSLSLSIPGSYARAWAESPREGQRDYVPAFTAVSVAVQHALRRWLPWLYFEDPRQYRAQGTAVPMIVYQCTLPRVGDAAEFTHDFSAPRCMALHRSSTLRRVRGELGRIHAVLAGLGDERLLDFYALKRAKLILTRAERFPRLFRCLLSGDGFLVDALTVLAGLARAYRGASESPAKTLQALSKRLKNSLTKFATRLRRLYPGADFSPLAPLLLIEATNALHSAAKGSGGVRGILTLACGDEERTFINAAFRP